MKELSQKCSHHLDNGTCKLISNLLKNAIHYISDSYIKRYCEIGDYHRCPVEVKLIDNSCSERPISFLVGLPLRFHKDDTPNAIVT
ncbi:MAG: hypothetical protein HQK91_01630 [Nitrospirae bacterium]|nr:hypothetical protein [Nitrospirota bacterium]MBF0540135.1 hypothetical protein [Nitrospirota bacterium]